MAVKLLLNISVRFVDELLSWSMTCPCKSDKDGVELMSDSAGERELESSVILCADPLSDFPVLSHSCLSKFRRYFALAFWNHTWKKYKPNT